MPPRLHADRLNALELQVDQQDARILELEAAMAILLAAPNWTDLPAPPAEEAA